MPETEPQLFEERRVDRRELKVSGVAADGAHTADPLHLDDEILVVGRFRVDDIGHALKEKKGVVSLVRVEKASGLLLYVVTGDPDAEALLAKAQADHRAALDEASGRDPLPGMNGDALGTVAESAVDAINAGALGPNVSASLGRPGVE